MGWPIRHRLGPRLLEAVGIVSAQFRKRIDLRVTRAGTDDLLKLRKMIDRPWDAVCAPEDRSTQCLIRACGVVKGSREAMGGLDRAPGPFPPPSFFPPTSAASVATPLRRSGTHPRNARGVTAPPYAADRITRKQTNERKCPQSLRLDRRLPFISGYVNNFTNPGAPEPP